MNMMVHLIVIMQVFYNTKSEEMLSYKTRKCVIGVKGEGCLDKVLMTFLHGMNPGHVHTLICAVINTALIY